MGNNNLVLPDVSGRLTDLGQEVEYLLQLLQARLRGYRVDQTLPIHTAILKILIVHCDGTKLTAKEFLQHERIIQESVQRGVPVPISLSVAIGARIPNPLKFSEQIPLPTYAWLYMLWVFKLINEKVKRVYAPGVHFYLFDEAQLFAGVIPGIESGNVRRHIGAVRKLIQKMKVPVTIIELTPRMLPHSNGAHLSVEIPDAVIYAMLCSLPQMTNRCIMDDLFQTRQRDYRIIKQYAGPMWEDARYLARVVSQTLALRKQNDLFRRLLAKHGIAVQHIDACITDKSARLVLDITSGAFFNHGMPVVERSPYGSHKVRIVPEYRIREQYPRARPVILPGRFSVKEWVMPTEYTFYYLIQG